MLLLLLLLKTGLLLFGRGILPEGEESTVYLSVFYTVIPGSGSTTGDYKVVTLVVGSKKTDYKVNSLVCYSAA